VFKRAWDKDKPEKYKVKKRKINVPLKRGVYRISAFNYCIASISFPLFLIKRAEIFLSHKELCAEHDSLPSSLPHFSLERS